MKVRMVSTQKGSPNGIAIKLYTKGKVYDVPDELGKVFLQESWAEKLRDVEKKTVKKALKAAPENK